MRAAATHYVGTQKSWKAREVPLSQEAIAALRGQMPRTKMRGELVFQTDTGRMITAGDFWDPIVAACKRAGLRQVGWHVLRHTFASHLAMLGVPLKVIQELLGHSTMTITLRYAHLTPVARREAVHLLDGAQGERGSYGHPTANGSRVGK